MSAESSNSVVLEFRHVSCRTEEGRALLSDINLEVRRGETLVLLGRSGSGKTTALKLINRLREASEGEVRVEGRATARSRSTRTPPCTPRHWGRRKPSRTSSRADVTPGCK